MRLQLLLSLAALTSIFPTLSLPIQYTDSSELEIRYDADNHKAYFPSRGYFELEDRENDPELVQRTGGGKRERKLEKARIAVQKEHRAARAKERQPEKPTPNNTPKVAKARMNEHTIGKPGNDQSYTVAGTKYSGKNVRQALTNFHLHSHLDPADDKVTSGSAITRSGSSHPHAFGNSAVRNQNDQPPSQPAALIPGYEVGPGNNLYEFPLNKAKQGYNGGTPGPARIVIQHHPPPSNTNEPHKYTFVGVVGHPGQGQTDFVQATHTS